jgi:hypothetical protein
MTNEAAKYRLRMPKAGFDPYSTPRGGLHLTPLASHLRLSDQLLRSDSGVAAVRAQLQYGFDESKVPRFLCFEVPIRRDSYRAFDLIQRYFGNCNTRGEWTVDHQLL